MHQWRKTLGAVVAICASGLASASASAQTTWSGLYGGSHTGFGWTGLDYTTGFAGSSSGPFVTSDSFSHSPSGLMGGGQVGLQHQWQNLVAGIEVSVSGSMISSTQDTPKFPGYVHEAELRFVNTVTGKLGYAWNNWLVYGKAGYAGAAVDMDYNKALTPGLVTAANRVKAHGWTAGIGVEHMWMKGVSTGIEYNYHRLEAGVDPFRLSNGNWQSQSDINMDVHSVLIRTNFHLHREAPAAEPMK